MPAPILRRAHGLLELGGLREERLGRGGVVPLAGASQTGAWLRWGRVWVVLCGLVLGHPGTTEARRLGSGRASRVVALRWPTPGRRRGSAWWGQALRPPTR